MRPEPELLLETRRFRVVRHAQPLADGSVHHRETVVHPARWSSSGCSTLTASY